MSYSRVRIGEGAPARAAAAAAVLAVDEGRSLTEAFPSATQGLDPRDRAFAMEIAYGTLRHARLLQEAMRPLLRQDPAGLHPAARAVLLTALYQIALMRTPEHAVVSASVGACALLRAERLCPLVNAVLRNFLRRGATLPDRVPEAVRLSCPDWLHQRLCLDHGAAAATDILERSQDRPPLWLRVELSKISREDYTARLAAEGIGYALSEEAPGAVRLGEPLPAERIPGFNEGLVTIQDLAAQLAAPLLMPRAGQRALDACAAPGGKSAHLLDLCPDLDLTMLDESEARLNSARDLLTRLGRRATLTAADAASPPDLGGPFDLILVDAPCSGTGVMRRHPDLKWLRRPQDIPALCRRAARILDAACGLLKPGGRLLFTTCSVLAEENAAQARALLARHPELLPEPFPMEGVQGESCQRLPGQGGGDGFFYARFVRRD
ncbi:MAG: 16S rRNA (cytosine(967)-C(5))-methyltransferase RsmB [Succinivibrionaceae bacterium]|nr:16S rRNA (cytosine(967)-C(5))-methyltransferase RsmB [Succinivibrionaceae bacterium]